MYINCNLTGQLWLRCPAIAMLKDVKILIFLILYILSMPSSGQVPRWEWAGRYGGASGVKIGSSIAINEDKNLYVAGSFYGNLTIGDTTIISSGNTDAFIARFNETGNLCWIRQGSGPIQNEATSVTLMDNFLYVAGFFDLENTFEDVHIEIDHTQGIFLAKYDLNGNLIWVHYEGPGGSGSCITGLNITNNMDKYLYLTGCFIHKGLNESYDDDIFVAKYDTAGNVIWVRQEGGNSFEGSWSVNVDSGGYVYNTGHFWDTIIFGDSLVKDEPDTIISYGESDIYISKYDSSANLVWLKQSGGALWDYGYSIASDFNNYIYITGSFYDIAIFEDTILTSRGENDIFILKLDSDRNRIWLKQIGSSGKDYGSFIYTDTNNNLYLVGNFQQTISIGDTSLISKSSYEFATNAFIAKFKNTGVFVWVKQIGSSWDMIEGIVTDDNGDVYITGSVYYITVYLDGIILPPVGSADFFLAKITENPVQTPEIEIQTKLQIYPNPGNGLINVYGRNLSVGNFQLEILDISGRLIYCKQITSNNSDFHTEIDLTYLSQGIYLLRIAGNDFYKTRKIIIN